jgi:hypothetical protein
MTQGVALGWLPSALSAPGDFNFHVLMKTHKVYFLANLQALKAPWVTSRGQRPGFASGRFRPP